MGLQFALLSFLLLLPLPVVAAEEHCSGRSEVIVNSDQAEVHDEICAAAGEGLAFLAQYDLLPKRPIVIDIVEEKIDNHGFLAYGRYETDIDRIELMSYRAIFANNPHPQIFGEPFDHIHYAAVIAHEVAHAVVEAYLRRTKFSATPQEYLAYATQLAVLPPARREKIIAAMQVGPWEGGDTISTIYMAMSPAKFAVKSYLQLVSLAEPKSFVQLLLEARWFDVYVPKNLPLRSGS